MISKFARKSAVSRGGFTLVELLVVIGIIALLISILLPSLNRVRQTAQTLKCSSNLRQIGVAMKMYANDYKNYLVPAGVYTDATLSSQLQSWATILSTSRYIPLQARPGGNWQLERTVFICPNTIDLRASYTPSSKIDQNGAGWSGVQVSGYGPGDTSYCINGWADTQYFNTYGPFNSIPMANAKGLSRSTTALHKYSDIHGSTDMVMLFDGMWMLNGVPNRINARHDGFKKTNLLFADGHVAPYITANLPNSTPTTNDLYSAAACSLTSDGAHWRLDQ